jgi:mono/diheme cytochrome c family protein
MMNSKIALFVIGAITACVVPAIFLGFAAGIGILPVQADVAPSSLETGLLRSALHSSVARHAPRGGNPQTSAETDSTQGAAIYRQLCSRCHGLTEQSDNLYGKSFYPPAPHLPISGTTFTEGEVFWIVKHGIRNTAMPAWGNLMSDDDIWKVAGVVRQFNSAREDQERRQHAQN